MRELAEAGILFLAIAYCSLAGVIFLYLWLVVGSIYLAFGSVGAFVAYAFYVDFKRYKANPYDIELNDGFRDKRKEERPV